MNTPAQRNDTLHTFVMALTKTERDAFCAACQTTYGNMQHMMYGRREIMADTAMLMEVASKGKLRADKISPEAAPWRAWLRRRKLDAAAEK